MTQEEAIAKLNADEAIQYEGARIVREGTDWCITYANGAFEGLPATGLGRVSATQIIERMDLFVFVELALRVRSS